jgi:tetratricopeptide (TPR) repeat protein
MDKKAKKSCEKAMDCYEKGKIDRALEICEEILSEGLDNPVVLNFKGLLLYQKGSLNEAIAMWEINKSINNNDIAENYIKDSIADQKRLQLYNQGEQELKQLRIDNALELFKKCIESDFNSIKVNTAIAMCYQRKGDFDNAKQYVDKALSVDKNAAEARVIEKELKEIATYLEPKKPSKKFFAVITVLFIISIIVIGAYLVILKVNDKDISDNNEKPQTNEVLNEYSIKNENEDHGVKKDSETNSIDIPKEENKQESKDSGFDKEKLKVSIESNDFDRIYDQLENVKEESINNEDKEMYKEAIGLIKDKGIAKFYEYGLSYFNQGNYLDAKIALDKGYKYCEGSSLKEHILFYRASTSYKRSDTEAALTQYEEYYKQYPKGVYVEEVLYELTLLSNGVDKDKSKKYASILMSSFPNSIYTNDKIISIIKS